MEFLYTKGIAVEIIHVGTADGLLTRSTKAVPSHSRARIITVTTKHSIILGSHELEINVSVSPSTILSCELTMPVVAEALPIVRIDIPRTNKRASSQKFYGCVWAFVDTSTWRKFPFDILKENAVHAHNAQDAIVEHLRFIMNQELRIRHVISDSVCDVVSNSISNSKNVNVTFKGQRMLMSEKPLHADAIIIK